MLDTQIIYLLDDIAKTLERIEKKLPAPEQAPRHARPRHAKRQEPKPFQWG